MKNLTVEIRAEGERFIDPGRMQFDEAYIVASKDDLRDTLIAISTNFFEPCIAVSGGILRRSKYWFILFEKRHRAFFKMSYEDFEKNFVVLGPVKSLKIEAEF